MSGTRTRILLMLAMFVVVCGVAASGASAGSGSTNSHFKVAYWDQSNVYWKCSGVHQVSKSGAVADHETCTTVMAQGSYGPFVTGAYNPNELYQTANYGSCAAITPALPGSPGNQTYWISDSPGFNKCAQFWTITYAPTSSGGWTETIDANY